MFPRTTRAVLTATFTAVLLVPGTAQTAAPAGSAERAVSARWAEITRIDGGYRFLASEHDNRLVLTRDGERVRFHDRAARRWRSLPTGCRPVAVTTGIAASCRVPTTAASPLLLEIVPRLGDDRVDGARLPAEFRLRVLGSGGSDVMIGGAGPDFFNGADGADRGFGGPGQDLLRLGDGDDVAEGGPGWDDLIGTAGNDHLSGNAGDDQLEGGVGDDTLLGGPGSDALLCGPGTDTSDDDGQVDGALQCEKAA